MEELCKQDLYSMKQTTCYWVPHESFLRKPDKKKDRTVEIIKLSSCLFLFHYNRNDSLRNIVTRSSLPACCQMRLRSVALPELRCSSKQCSLSRHSVRSPLSRKSYVWAVAIIGITIFILSVCFVTILYPRRERIAVCFGGNARTFRLNFTHEQILKHVIAPLKKDYRTDVFFVISLDDPPRGKLPVARRDPPGTMSAIAKFGPTAVRLLDTGNDELVLNRIRRIYRNHQPPIDIMLPPSSCAFASNESIRVAHTLLRARQCLDLISDHETRAGMKYDWVYRLRPDVVLLQDVLFPKFLNRDTYYSNQGRTNVTAALGGWWASKHGHERNGGAVADQVAIMSRQVAAVALRAFDASDDCRFYSAPFLLLPEEVLRFWLLEKGIRYRALPFDWAIVREKLGLECFRLFHQFGPAPDGRQVDWKSSIRKCLLVAHSVKDLFPDMPPLDIQLKKLDETVRYPNEITTT